MNIIKPAKCGPLNVSFFLDDGLQTALDHTLFKDFQDISGNKFKVLSTKDATKVGVYKITYKIALSNYLRNFIVQPGAFTVTVVDPCAKPLNVTPSALKN